MSKSCAWILLKIQQRSALCITKSCPGFTTWGAELAIVALIRDALQWQPGSYHLVDSAHTPMKGLSKAKIFFIYDLTAMQYVVKVFQRPQRVGSPFFAELSGISHPGAQPLPGDSGEAHCARQVRA